MHSDRSSDARKAPQQWNAKITQPPRGSGGNGTWIIVGGALACLLLIGVTVVMFWTIARQREESALAQAQIQAQANLRQWDAAPPDYRDLIVEPPAGYFLSPSVPEVNSGPSVDYSATPRFMAPSEIQDGTKNTFVFPAAPDTVAPPFLPPMPQIPDGWGHLRGRFVVAGELPKLPPLKINADQEFARQCDLRNESIVTGPAGELANVIVFLTIKPPAIHPDYAKAANAEVTLRTEKCRFEPRICLLRSTQTLKLVNADPIGHEPHAYLDRQGWSAPLTQGDPQTRRLSATEMPSLVECDMHPWMRAWLLVRDNPYMAVTGKDGSFEIKNLPAGVNLEFEAWHEMPGSLTGRFNCRLAADQVQDLGTRRISAERLKSKSPAR